MSKFTQKNRLISIATPLAEDELLLTSFQGVESISKLFDFQVEVLSKNLAVNPKDIVGKEVTITIQNDQKRTFNGYVSRFSFGEIQSNNLRQYKMTMVPWLWFLSKTQNNRIFQNENTKAIVLKVFNSLGFKDFDFKAQGGSNREYCVQYAESDLNFVSRLLEEEGIAYYFKQDKKKHTLVLVDQKNAYEECAETDLTYSKGTQPNAQINRWEHQYEYRKGEWTLSDYNFKEPGKNLIVKTKSKSKFAKNGNYEHYEYPGLYDTTAGKALGAVRMDSEEVQINTIEASSDCSSFYAGGKFKLKHHDANSEKGDYVITGIHHKAHDSSYFTGSEGQSEYGNDFVCIPEDVHFRPMQIHLKPVMKGPQSAIVTGQSGEEIHIDEFGRIKAQFIWDREGKNNENSSCYLRVVQSWSGNQWGSSFIPRIGQEVIVNFLDGDPDRPLVTGTVYNGDNKPPYGSKTQSGIKTQSTKNATKDEYNELRFEDLKGSEEIYIQAQKDFRRLVKNDEEAEVQANQKQLIKKNRNITVAEGNETIVISKGNRTLSVKNKIKTDASDILIEAKKSIELKVGGSSIKISPAGIVIKSTKVDIKGTAMVVIKGGITKIN